MRYHIDSISQRHCYFLSYSLLGMCVFVHFVRAFTSAIVEDDYLSHADTSPVMLLLNNYT